jgi:hypothetical protein
MKIDRKVWQEMTFAKLTDKDPSGQDTALVADPSVGVETMISALRGAGVSKLGMLRSITEAGFWREAVTEAIERPTRWGTFIELAAIVKRIPADAVLDFAIEIGGHGIHPMSVAYKMQVEVPPGTPSSVGILALERLRETATNRNPERLIALVEQDFKAIKGMVIHLDAECFNLDPEIMGPPVRVVVEDDDCESMRKVNWNDGLIDPCWYVKPAEPVDERFATYANNGEVDIERMRINAPTRWLANDYGTGPAEEEDFDL